MKTGDWVTLTRDCEALLIPTAVPITLPGGSRVLISQTLGGTYTVNVNGNLARVDAKDADALGVEAIEKLSKRSPSEVTGPVNIDEIWDAMRTCYDPEIPVNIVELGLIYECEAQVLENGGNQVNIQMTLTAPGCGMGPVLAQDVEQKCYQIDNVTEVNVELVFDPQWNMEMMSEAAKLTLGML